MFNISPSHLVNILSNLNLNMCSHTKTHGGTIEATFLPKRHATATIRRSTRQVLQETVAVLVDLIGCGIGEVGL